MDDERGDMFQGKRGQVAGDPEIDLDGADLDLDLDRAEVKGPIPNGWYSVRVEKAELGNPSPPPLLKTLAKKLRGRNPEQQS